jgi:hypothetical protein
MASAIAELDGQSMAPAEGGAEPVATGALTPAEDPMEAIMDLFCGGWSNVKNDNLEAYLKHIGISWAKRKIALSFKPQSSYAVVDGVLQVMTPTPLGDRLETFPLNEEQTDEIEGKKFTKTHRWVGSKMVTTAKDPTGAKPDFVTERWVDEATDQLHQVTSHAGVAFTRLFSRQ